MGALEVHDFSWDFGDLGLLGLQRSVISSGTSEVWDFWGFRGLGLWRSVISSGTLKVYGFSWGFGVHDSY